MILKRCTPDLLFHRWLRKVIIESSLRIYRRLLETPDLRRRYDESAYRFRKAGPLESQAGSPPASLIRCLRCRKIFNAQPVVPFA